MEEKTKTAIEGFLIRRAKIADVNLILELIRELAEYEKLLDQVKVTSEQLQLTLFSERPAAEILIAEYQGHAVGFALFFHNYSTFLGQRGIYLEDLYIKPQFRRQGFGRQLLSYLAKLAVERNCGRFEWSVLDWNSDALDFYRQLGAKPMSDWTVQRLCGNELISLANKFAVSSS